MQAQNCCPPALMEICPQRFPTGGYVAASTPDPHATVATCGCEPIPALRFRSRSIFQRVPVQPVAVGAYQAVGWQRGTTRNHSDAHATHPRMRFGGGALGG